MPSVYVCFPTTWGLVKAECAVSLANMDWGDADVEYGWVNNYAVDKARTRLAEAALDGGFTHVLMVDSDMVVPRDALVNLLSHDLDVCMGFGVRGSSDDGTTSVSRLGGQFENWYNRSELRELREKGQNLLEVKGNGLCCALISTDVFRRLKKPWFEYRGGKNPIGEDYWFCMQCSGSGIRLHVDTRVACGHIHDRTLEAE